MTTDAYRIDVFCDRAPWHSPKRPRVAVMAYVKRPGTGWTDLYPPAQRRMQGAAVRRTTLRDDRPIAGADMSAMDPQALRELRVVDRLECRVCRQYAGRHRTEPLSLDLREQNLDALLDRLRAAGMHEVSLAWLAEGAGRAGGDLH